MTAEHAHGVRVEQEHCKNVMPVPSGLAEQEFQLINDVTSENLCIRGEIGRGGR